MNKHQLCKTSPHLHIERGKAHLPFSVAWSNRKLALQLSGSPLITIIISISITVAVNASCVYCFVAPSFAIKGQLFYGSEGAYILRLMPLDYDYSSCGGLKKKQKRAAAWCSCLDLIISVVKDNFPNTSNEPLPLRCLHTKE